MANLVVSALCPYNGQFSPKMSNKVCTIRFEEFMLAPSLP